MNTLELKNYFPSESKSATFSTAAVDVEQYHMFVVTLTTASQSSLNVSAQLLCSVDGVNYVNVGSATAITTNTTNAFGVSDNYWKFCKITVTRTAGSATFSAALMAKG
jgi:hypothetical protein